MKNTKHIHWDSAYVTGEIRDCLNAEAEARNFTRGEMIQFILEERYGVAPSPKEIAKKVRSGKQKPPRKALATAGE